MENDNALLRYVIIKLIKDKESSGEFWKRKLTELSEKYPEDFYKYIGEIFTPEENKLIYEKINEEFKRAFPR